MIYPSDHIDLFNNLFDEYFTSLCYYSESITKDREEAKDIVIESFQKFWVRRENFLLPVQVKSFLYLVTKNASIDYLKRKNVESINKNTILNTIAETEEDTGQLIVEAELLRKIYQEAAALPGKCRAVFELTYFEGLNTTQIAERLDMTVSNVTSQRSRAIQLLRLKFTESQLLAFFLLFTGIVSEN